MRILIRLCYFNFNRRMSIACPEIGMVSPEFLQKIVAKLEKRLASLVS